MTSKAAECIRTVANFSTILPEFKFDKSKFDKEKLKESLPDISPKLVKLFTQIKELDAADKKKDKKYYKHCIYVDFKGVSAKMVAAAFISEGFNAAYDKNFKVDETTLAKTKGDNFMFLSSSTLYDKTFPVKVRKQLLEIFNRRPENIEGDLLRFIILDSGFREGIDVYDTKYCHIIQDLSTNGDLKQAVGRNTRSCGQAGLKFSPTKGWPLHVYKYDVSIPDELQETLGAKRMFQLYLNHSGIDIRKIILADDLEKVIPDIAVDYELTKSVHEFSIESASKSKSLSLSKPESKQDSDYDSEGGGKKRRNPLHPQAPRTRKNSEKMQEYVRDRFSQYKWPPAKLENQCQSYGGGLVEFTPSQNFSRFYFQPQSAYKGILLYHSVGTGKTCSAIATASTSWEPMGYTILWVTRHTLKADIYKNLFRDVCSLVIKEKLKNGEIKLPEGTGAIKSPSQFLSKNWMLPISFKQFSNMCMGKNAIYKDMVKRNGSRDILKKTLLIIDEAHKIYAKDVIGSERPNAGAIEEAIQHSYEVSGDNSVRVLLMTATPYTSDPIDMIRLLNLMRPTSEALPVDFEKFYNEYLDDDGSFSRGGKALFANDVSGYISYLNREKDARQFSYPVFHDIVVPMSRSKIPEAKNDLEKIHQYIAELKDGVKTTQNEIKETKQKIKNEIQIAQEKCKTEPVKERKKCKENIKTVIEKKGTAIINELEEKIEDKTEELNQSKNEIKIMKKNIKELDTNDLSQEHMLHKHCRIKI